MENNETSIAVSENANPAVSEKPKKKSRVIVIIAIIAAVAILIGSLFIFMDVRNDRLHQYIMRGKWHCAAIDTDFVFHEYTYQETYSGIVTQTFSYEIKRGSRLIITGYYSEDDREWIVHEYGNWKLKFNDSKTVMTWKDGDREFTFHKVY